MPDAIAAPVAAPAPSAPAAPSTPAPAPVAPAAPAPTPTPTATPATPATPSTSTPATPVATPEPNRAEFGDNIEGFLSAHIAWEEAQNADTPAEEDAVNADAPAADAPAADAPAAEETPAAEADKPAAEEVHPAATPEFMAGAMEKNEQFKAALEADPALKGQLFQMARQNAKLAPMGEIFPNVESAKFASETANKFVGMRTAFMLGTEDPTHFDNAFNQLVNEFTEVDANGNPVMENGRPKLGEDFHMLASRMVEGRDTDRIASLEAALEANKFLSDEARENHEQALLAAQFLKSFDAADPMDLNKPDLSGLSPEALKAFEDREKAIRDQEEKLGIKQKASKKEDRIAERRTYENSFNSKYGASLGERLGKKISERLTAGADIPQYVLESRDPKTGVSVFALNVFEQVKAKIKADPDAMFKAGQLQIAKPSDDALNQRLAFHMGEVDKYLDEVLDAEIRKASRKAAPKAVDSSAAAVEPKGASASRPRVMTAEAAMTEAKRTVDAKFAGKYVDQADKMAEYIKEKNRLMGN